MGLLAKRAVLCLAVGSCVLLSACLSPQERSEIYGGHRSQETGPDIMKPDNPVKPAQPAKPAMRPAPAMPALRTENGNQVSVPTRPSPSPVPAKPAMDACGAANLQNLRGKPLSTLNSMQFSQPLRIILPGQMVTQDYRPERLNVEIDAQSVIVRVRCG